MATMRTFIRRHPVLGYFVLTFAISWGGMILAIGGPGRLPLTAEKIARLFPVAYLATVAGPGLSALLWVAVAAVALAARRRPASAGRPQLTPR